jgi:hypothetical protein
MRYIRYYTDSYYVFLKAYFYLLLQSNGINIVTLTS